MATKTKNRKPATAKFRGLLAAWREARDAYKAAVYASDAAGEREKVLQEADRTYSTYADRMDARADTLRCEATQSRASDLYDALMEQLRDAVMAVHGLKPMTVENTPGSEPWVILTPSAIVIDGTILAVHNDPFDPDETRLAIVEPGNIKTLTTGGQP